MNMTNSQSIENSSTCPFLSAVGDPSFHFGYATPGNYCYHVTPAQGINLSHQQDFCLTKSFQNCPVFSPSWDGPLPPEILGEEFVSRKLFISRRHLLFLGLISLALIIIFVIINLIIQKPNNIIVNQNFSPTPTLLITTQEPFEEILLLSPTISIISNQSASSIYTPTKFTPTPTLSKTPTPIPSATSSPTITPGPGIGTPFGSKNIYLLHRVGDGESFTTMSQSYNTSIEVLTAANILIEGASLWKGTIIVVMPNQIDAVGVTKFKVILLETSTTVDELAQEYKVSTDELRTINSLGQGEFIPEGRWIIIPIVEE